MRSQDLDAAREAIRDEQAERPPLKTLEDVRALSEEETNERWEEVAVVLESGGAADEEEIA